MELTAARQEKKMALGSCHGARNSHHPNNALDRYTHGCPPRVGTDAG